MNKEYIKLCTNYIVSDEQGNLRVLESESGQALEQKLRQENKVENLESSSKTLKNKLIESKRKINLLDYSCNIKYAQNVDIRNIIVEPKLSIEETNSKEKENTKKLELI